MFCKYNQEKTTTVNFASDMAPSCCCCSNYTGEATRKTKRLNSRLPKTLKYFFFNDSLLAFFRSPLRVFVREGVTKNSLCDRQVFVALLLENNKLADGCYWRAAPVLTVAQRFHICQPQKHERQWKVFTYNSNMV